jgi:hypothetical protein
VTGALLSDRIDVRIDSCGRFEVSYCVAHSASCVILYAVGLGRG